MTEMRRIPSEHEQPAQQPASRLISRPAALSILLIAVALASCDAVAPSDAIVLQEKTATFRFEIDSQNMTAGESIQVTSEDSADLGPALSNDGYTKGEVLSATVTRVELERINPTTVDLSILDEAVLALTASGISARTVGSSTSLPASRTATLSVSSNPDVTGFVVAPSFQGSLSIVPAVVPQSQLVLRATVSFRIEVEGV